MRCKSLGHSGSGLAIFFLMQPVIVQSIIAQQKLAKPFVQEGHLTAADNVDLFYRRVGKGSGFIVFLHGGPGLSMENDGFLMDPLADKGHTVIMYDQRGGGRSEIVKDPARLTAASHVRDLDALREHFGFHIFPALAAMILTGRRPRLLAGRSLVCAGCRRPLLGIFLSRVRRLLAH